MSAVAPGAIRPAQDEQVVRIRAGPPAFGCGMTLIAFLGLFGATQAGWIAAEAAFCWRAPVLAAVASLCMLVASPTGRAA